MIIGVGAVPAFISLFLRRLIPETPHYLAKQGKVDDAVEAAGLIYAPGATLQPTGQEDVPSEDSVINVAMSDTKEPRRGLWATTIKHFAEARDHPAEHGRWRPLLGIAAAWFLRKWFQGDSCLLAVHQVLVRAITNRLYFSGLGILWARSRQS